MMRDRGVTALAVIDVDSRDPGIITEADIGRAMAADSRPAQAHGARLPHAGRDRRDLRLDPRTRRPHDGRRPLPAPDGRRGAQGDRDPFDERHRRGLGARPRRAAGRGLRGDRRAAQARARARVPLQLRRTAKQHLVAAKCPCQWEWCRCWTANSRTGRTSTRRRSSTCGSGASPARRCTPRAAARSNSLQDRDQPCRRPALAPTIFSGKQATLKPVGGSAARLNRRSICE